jgi:DNA helicase-2/ATP-dependent DNA helicase PcrA
VEQEVERPSVEEALGEAAGSEPSQDPSRDPTDALAQAAAQGLPIVQEELSLLQVVLKKLDSAQRRSRIAVDDAGALIELRDALAEAKPEDQGSLLEQMHRIEALSRQRGKGDSPPVDRKSPYFGHMRLEEAGRRRDVLIGQRGYVEPGGGVQIVDWRNAPVSRLFYRYEEGDYYEEQLGDRMVEGEIVARRTVTIVNAELRRVNSVQGTYARDLANGQWREVNVRQAKLSVARDGSVTVHSEPPPGVLPAMPAGQAKAARHASHAGRGRLGMDSGQARVDRFLPAIAALIDPRQFELITRPTSGLIVVQGSAGSGKTTIGLHRIAYLAFADPKRFKPERMLVVVYQRALATYVSRVLPSLDVPGVPVMTFSAWAEQQRRATFSTLHMDTTDGTPSVVVRAKSHGAMLKILEDRQAALAAWCRAQLAEGLAALSGDAEVGTAMTAVLEKWDASSGPVDLRVTTLAKWVKEAPLSPQARATIEGLGARLRSRTRDVIGEWAALLTDRQALGAGFDRHAPGVFKPGQLDEMVRWCSERERKRTAGRADQDDSDPYALDVEDDALLLRIFQLQRGALGGKSGPVAYEHLMVDEVQDFAPVELAVLLDSTTKERSITLAGDTAQAIAPDHGFDTWSDMLDHLGIPHDRVEPLRVSYRSTREIVDVAQHVLGPLQGDVRPVAPRSGAPVESFGFSSAGEASDFLPQALKELMRSEPSAAVAVISRHPEQARLYYEALVAAEVPHVRLVANQDFSFRPGIDVTDVRQTKGLEFDIVILVEVNEESYPTNEFSRRMLHVAMTRAAHQLWITFTGRPSPLLPEYFR